MGKRILTSVIAVLGAAALTLASLIVLVRATILAVAIGEVPLRVLAVAADVAFGSILLLGCIYLATQLAVRIVGVGSAEFPPVPVQKAPEILRFDHPEKK